MEANVQGVTTRVEALEGESERLATQVRVCASEVPL